MNTGKQVYAMIGLLFLLIVVSGAYLLNEGSRQSDAREEHAERNAGRGARLFVANCRTCHGLEGLGPEEGGIGSTLNTPAFLVITDSNLERIEREYGVEGLEPTSLGDAGGIRVFLRDTIACGRTGKLMPPWSQRFGGPLSDTQVEQLVTLIIEGRWDLVIEEGHEADAESGDTREDIVVTDTTGLPLTERNCGQYTGLTALDFRTRDPFAEAAATGIPGAEETATPPAGEDGVGSTVQGLPVAEFFQATCAVCHGQQRQGVPGLGLPLTPEALTQPDDFYSDTIKNGRPNTAMPAWGAQGLTDDEIRALVQFITTEAP